MADFTPTAVANSSNFVSGTGDTTSDVLTDLLDNRTEIYGLMSDIAEQFYGTVAPTSPNIGTLWYDSSVSVLKRWSGTAWVTDVAAFPFATSRNAVLQGNVDSIGNAALFTGATGALTVQLNATTTPCILSWMDGNDTTFGIKNKIGNVSANSATFWSGLPQSSTVYLYIELVGSTISGNYSTVAPKYQYHEPTHSAGLDWINFNKGEVYNSDGSTWTKKYRIYVGQVTTSATAVTSSYVYHYAKEGKEIYDLLWSEKFLFNKPTSGYVSPPLRITRDGKGDSFFFDMSVAPASATVLNMFYGDGGITTEYSLSAAATTMIISDSLTLDANQYIMLDINNTPEIVKVTGGSGTDTLTITRAQEGTVGVVHSAGAIILPSYAGNVTLSSAAPVEYNSADLLCNQDDLFAYAVNGAGLNKSVVVATQKWRNP